MNASIKALLVGRGPIFLAAVVLLGATGEAHGDSKVELDVSMATPAVLAGQPQTAYLKVGLTGFELDAKKRGPVNLAVVIDRSSSMQGERIEKAKEAALMIIDRLDDRDVVSVVAYDTSVQVLVPATPLSERESVKARIRAIQPAGSTALFAGVSRGIAEARKFIESGRVSRVILLSDGQANVGPSSPNELAKLGKASAKERISITTIGLGAGYNEDLMTQLALASDGNHAFVQDAQELTKIFNYELGDVLSVVAQEVSIKVRFAPGAHPVRVLGRSAEIHGQEVVLSLNQLYSRQEKYFLFEVHLDPHDVRSMQDLAEVEVSYGNLLTKKTDRLTATAQVAFAATPREVEEKTNKKVMVAVVEAIAADNNRRAIVLRDEGKMDEAKRVLIDNSSFLQKSANKYESKKLEDYGRMNSEDADNLDATKWTVRRKAMRSSQHKIDTQQAY